MAPGCAGGSGSRGIAEIWLHARVYSPSNEEWQTTGYVIHRVRRDRFRRVYELVISTPGRGSHWLELKQLESDRIFGCVLPETSVMEDQVHDTRYLVEMCVDDSDTLTRVDVSLALENAGMLGEAARLWRRYRIGGSTIVWSPAVAAAFHNTQGLELTDRASAAQFVRETWRSPIAAVITALISLRTSNSEDLGDWLGGLARWFPWIPDGLVLWVEQLIRREKYEDAALAFVELGHRGVPWTVIIFFVVEILEIIEDVSALTPRLAFSGLY